VLRIQDQQNMNEEVARLLQTQSPRRQRDAETLANLRADVTSGKFLDQLSLLLGFQNDPRVVEQARRSRQTQAVSPNVTDEELVLRRLREFLRKKIQVHRTGPRLFSVSYYDANPDACYIVADAIVKLYIEEQQKQKIIALRDVSDFSDEQLAVYKERLEASERELEDFLRRTANDANSSNPVTQTNIGVAETLLRQLEIEVEDGRNVVESTKAKLLEHIKFVPSEDLVNRDPEVKNTADELVAQLDADLLQQLQSVNPSAAGMTEAGDEVARIQVELQVRLNELIRNTYPDIERDYRPLIDEHLYQVIKLRSQEEKLRKLREYVDAYRRQVQMAPQLQSELQRLQANVDANRTTYESFFKAKTSTQISEAAQNTQLGATMEVVEEATYPLVPVKPNKPKILLLAVLFGITIGGGGLILTEFTDTSFKTVEEVEKQLEIRVIGTVPRIDNGVAWHGDNRRKRVAVWSATLVILTAVSIFAFYFYGKSTKEQGESIQVTSRHSQFQE
jgi:succinoglycan biosynthesis transport protein ExoP